MDDQMRWRVQRLKNLWHLVRTWYWVYKCGFPARKLTVVGVTGTDGKTTTATLLYEVLKRAGKRVGVITTLGAKIDDENLETGLHTTNPDAAHLQPILVKMVGAGITHLVLEVTAHGLDQHRVDGCNFYMGVFTNLSREHLDDFVTMDKYRKAKSKLFGKVKVAVLNRDDEQFEYFRNVCQPGCRIIEYTESKLAVSQALRGDYNLYNVGAVEAACGELGIDEKIVARVVGEFAGVPGRREEVNVGQKFRVVVDFAHTPNGLEKVASELRKELGEKSGARLIIVFGCTGERDKGKRPIMGKVAASLADIVVVTSDDTRKESQDEIYKQIARGITNIEERIGKGTVIKENDREKAIEKAVGMARPGDIVLLAGKGHEKTILLGTTEFPWSDQEVAADKIRALIRRSY